MNKIKYKKYIFMEKNKKQDGVHLVNKQLTVFGQGGLPKMKQIKLKQQ